MGINRRNFFKVIGVTGATLALGKDTNANQKTGNEIEFKGILYDSTRCVGCQTCEFSCAEANNLPEPTDFPEVGVVRKTDETRRTVVNVYDTSKAVSYTHLTLPTILRV